MQIGLAHLLSCFIHDCYTLTLLHTDTVTHIVHTYTSVEYMQTTDVAKWET